MSENNSTITTLRHLLDYDVRKSISGELQLRDVLPVWINKASSLKLKEVLHKYLEFVQQHLDELVKFIESEKLVPISGNNRVINAFIEEAEERLNHCTDPEVQDACLLACVQEINHFKISSYGTAAAFSGTLGMEKQAEAFHEAEVNEKQIDDRLSQLAGFEINAKACFPILLTE